MAWLSVDAVVGTKSAVTNELFTTKMSTLAGKGVRFSGRERVALLALERRFEKHGWSPYEESILMEQRMAFAVIAFIAEAPAGVEIYHVGRAGGADDWIGGPLDPVRAVIRECDANLGVNNR
ncbi:MAG: hypothetical protein ACRD2X_08015 [Vicinamibacteraceae bacterium]